jgi:signal transduction histidine kinase
MSTDSSDYYFLKAKRLITTDKQLAEYLFCKNAIHTDAGNHDSAVYYGNRAAAKFVKHKDYEKLFYVYNNLGKTYLPRGDYDKAIAVFLKGLKVAEQTNNHQWIIEFNQRISVAYHDFEDFQKGVFYGKKAYAHYINNKDVGNVGPGILNAIAINFDDWKKPDSALYYHFKTIALVKGKDTITLASTYNNIGNTLLKQKKYKEARKWIERAVNINEANKANLEELTYQYEVATTNTNLATIAYTLNEYEYAEAHFQTAYAAAIACKNVEKLRDYYYQQYLFNKRRKNIDRAFYFQDEYVKIRDSVFNMDRAKTFAGLEARYQNEKKEKELSQSKAVAAQSALSVKKKHVQVQILLLISAALISIGYLVYRQQRLKNRQMVQEHELKSAIAQIEMQSRLQDQRLNISRDLHDNIGAQLTFIISSVDSLKYAFDIANTKLDNKLQSISSFARETIIELRDTIWAMNSNEIMVEDLSARILNFIEKAREANDSIVYDFHVDDEVKGTRFSSIQGMNIYRTVQEAVNNALKYASATSISIEFNNRAELLQVTVTDNGSGFDMNSAEMGNGIRNMRKRMEDIGGSFEITSSNTGTSVTVTLPNQLS